METEYFCLLYTSTNHKLTAARDVADPWYTGDFDATFDDVISGCRGLLEYIKEVYNL